MPVRRSAPARKGARSSKTDRASKAAPASKAARSPKAALKAGPASKVTRTPGAVQASNVGKRGGRGKTRYSPHPSLVMIQNWIRDLPEKTGRSMEQWIAVVKKDGPGDEKAAREWLKKEHQLGTNSAGYLAERAFAAPGALSEEDPEQYLQIAEQYVESMFAGGKAGLRRMYDQLLDLGLGIAPDVKACPCKTIVPFYREHVIAQIKPTTRTRIDFGLALAKYKGKLPARLIDTGGLAKKDRITHRIEITSVKDIDQDVVKWMRIAYELDE